MKDTSSQPPSGGTPNPMSVAIAPTGAALNSSSPLPPSSSLHTLPKTSPHTHAPRHAPGRVSVLQAARALDQCAQTFADGLSIDDIARDLEVTLFSDDDADMLLHTQARILDTLFKRIAADDMHDTWNNKPSLREHKIDLALRTQRHCRNTVEALNRCRYRRMRAEVAESGVE